MRVDLHTHVVPPRWDDWAARFGGGKWPRLVAKDACHATIMTGDQFFRDIDDRSWEPARRLEDMDRLGIDVQVLSPPPVMFCYWAEAKVRRHGHGPPSRSRAGDR
jgi:aminocarboxymuconate-semialdehyde decarboxylase